MNQTTNRTFHVLEVAVAMTACVGSVLERLRRADGNLARQVQRAAASVPLNLAEGNGRRGGDRLHFFRIAAGSADEVRVGLRVAVGLGMVSRAEVAEALGLVDRIVAMTWRLTHPRR